MKFLNVWLFYTKHLDLGEIGTEKIYDIHNELACVSVQFWEESTPQKTNWFVIPKIIQKMGEKNDSLV